MARSRGHKLYLRRPRRTYGGERVLVQAWSHRRRRKEPGVRYELPIVEFENGKLFIYAGNIDAFPEGTGAGSAFLSTVVHPMFQEMARRTGITVVHHPWVTNNGARDFFIKRHGYEQVVDDYEGFSSKDFVKREFPPRGKPKPLSENQERAMRMIFGRHYRRAD